MSAGHHWNCQLAAEQNSGRMGIRAWAVQAQRAGWTLDSAWGLLGNRAARDPIFVSSMAAPGQYPAAITAAEEVYASMFALAAGQMLWSVYVPALPEARCRRHPLYL